jgi:hypothetical protein
MGGTHDEMPAIRQQAVRDESNRMMPHGFLQHPKPPLIIARPLKPARTIVSPAEHVEEMKLGLLATGFAHQGPPHLASGMPASSEMVLSGHDHG